MKDYFELKDIDDLLLFPIDVAATDLPIDGHRDEIVEILKKEWAY